MARLKSSHPSRRSISHEPKEFEQRVIDLSRVTRVMAGGKRMRFRACVAIGDGKARVGVGLAKGLDVTMAINKAVAQARKHLVTIPLRNETIPHRVLVKYGAAMVLLKPAPKGTGIIAGGPIRILMDLAGVKNIVAKMLGSSSKINNVAAVLEALRRLVLPERIRELRQGAAVAPAQSPAPPEGAV